MYSGYNNFFIFEDGTAKAIGMNNFGQLGFGAVSEGESVYRTINLPGIKQISSSISHTVFLMKDGTYNAVGQNNLGQLGLGHQNEVNGVVQKGSLTGIKDIDCGEMITILLMNDGTLKGVGANGYGQLGLGNTIHQTTFQSLPISGVKQISMGSYHVMCLMEDGTVKATGYNEYGQLGLGDTSNRTSFTTVPITEVKKIFAANYSTFFLMNDGKVKAAGLNDYGQIGLGRSNDNVPYGVNSIQTLSILGVKHISAAASHTLFLLEDETVKVVGTNRDGRLGLGTVTPKEITLKTVPITGVKKIYAGAETSLFILKDGTVRLTGGNSYGIFGKTSTEMSYTPYLTDLNLSSVKLAQSLKSTDIKYLIQDGSSIKTYLNNAWTTLGASPLVKSYLDQGMTSLAALTDTTLSQLTAASPELLAWYEEDEGAKTLTMAGPIWEEVATSLPTPEDMALKGMPEIKDIPAAAWQALGGDFEVITHTNVLDETQKVYLEAMPKSQLVQGATDFTNVAQMALVASAGVKVIVSSDSGLTWKTFTNGAWASILPTVDAVKASGMTLTDFNLLTADKWAVLSSKARLAYLLEGEAILDKITVTKVQVTDSTPSIDSMQVEYEELTLAGRLKELERLNAINLAKLNFKANVLSLSDAYKLDDMVIDTFEKDSALTTGSSADETVEQAFSATSAMGDGFYSEVTINQAKTMKSISVR